MVLNSISFLIFFVIVCIVYHCFYKEYKIQNIILLLSSYFFYAYADVKMLPIIIGMTILFYFLGLKIGNYRQKNESKKAYWLTTLTVVLGLLPLLYFKYFNFFISSFEDLFSLMGLHTNHNTFKIILPLGISFFTFRLVSYAVEINRNKLSPTKDIISFAVYVAFFPCLLSGPIDKPNKFLPQIENKRNIKYEDLFEGLKRILWGWFMKVCVADRLGIYIDSIFTNYTMHTSASILLASVLYPMQMYFDFAGYSHMAIGLGKLLGITVTENFNRPFFAQNVAEYWRRWHISLTTWLTDYVFIPLNLRFRNLGNLGIILAIIINFIVVGFWHGDNWTFGVFGLYHGLLFIPLILNGKMNKKNKVKLVKGYFIPLKPMFKMILTYLIVTFGLMIFRSPSVVTVIDIFKQIFSNHSTSLYYDEFITYALIFMCISLFKDYKDEYKLNIHFLHSENKIIEHISVILLIVVTVLFGVFRSNSFIYFQF